MQVTVTIRHIDSNDRAENLRNYVLKRVKRAERYIQPKKNPSEIRVVLSAEKFRNTCEILVNSGTLKIASSVEGEDMYTAIDRAVDSTIKQLKKQADKKIKVKRRGTGKSKEETTAIMPTSPNPVQREGIEDIDFEKVPSKPMSVEEALLQLNVSGDDLLTFRNSETGEINALYRRKGGRIVLIAP
jgi:putative sigma-54 modulation protein